MRSRSRPLWLGWISKAWRTPASGLAFATFGLWSLWLSLVWLPLRGWIDPPRADPWRRAQRAIHRMYRLHVRMMQALGVIEVHWIGAERLTAVDRPRIIVANHPSLIDVELIVSNLPQADCIVASSRAENRWLKGAIRAADYIANDSGAEVVSETVRRLREGRTVLIFPEGTRSPETGLGRFQRGAAHVALATGLDMLPVEIDVSPRMLMKGYPWYHVPPSRGVYTVRVGEPLVAKEHLDGGESTVLGARKLTRALRARFARELTESGDGGD
jgi:1-acyl-sn-glycerol-3-phosphate acyltransferase